VRTAGVKVGTASVASLRAGAGHPHVTWGGNVYLPRDWAFGITPGERPVPLCGSPFQTSPPRTRMRDRRDGHTRGAKQIASAGARYGVTRVQGDQVPQDRVPAKCASRARIQERIMDEDPGLAGEVTQA